MRIREPNTASISRRLLAANAAVLVLAVLLLALTPVTVSAPIGAAELAVLVAGGLALLAINWALIGVTMMGRREADRLQTSRAVLAGQEGERLRVARELHDEVGQGLIAITLMAERAAAESSPDVAEKFSAIADELLFYLDELRRIAHELRPETLDDLGLVNALDALCNGVGADRGVVVDRDLYGRFDELSGEQELVLYRVAQEALANAARHADASRVSLRLAERRSELTLEVLDDGRGVTSASGDGVGIKGMRERARLVGGSFEIGPNPGSGTRVKLVMPLERAG
jgi:two-component system sensor histidine kinase UhpB